MLIQQHKNNDRNRAIKILTGLLTCLTLLLVPGKFAIADERVEESQKQRIARVYKQTKTAKTTKDFTRFVDSCRELLAQEFDDDNKKYLRSLIAWGLNRRGEKRLETADLLLEAGNIEQGDKALVSARADFEQATQNDPQRARAWLCRGIANARQFDFDMAISDFSTAIELDETNSKIYFNRAESYYELGQFAEAISDYDVVLKRDSADLQALTGRGHCFYEMAEYEKAFSEYDSVAGLHPNHPMALANRAEANQMLGRWQDALDDYMASIKIHADGVVLQKAAWMFATCPDESFLRPEESLLLCDRAITEMGRTPNILETQAAAESAKGNYPKSEVLQTQARSLAESLDKKLQSRIAIYKHDNATLLSKRLASLKSENLESANRRRE